MDVSIFHQQLKVSRETKVINWYLANLSIREMAFFMELCVCVYVCVFLHILKVFSPQRSYFQL